MKLKNNINKKYKIIAFFIAISLIIIAYSIDIYGGSPNWMPYNCYISSSRGLAVGGAFSGIADDSSTISFNPAGLVNLRRNSIIYIFDTQLWIERFSSSAKFNYGIPSMIAFSKPFMKKVKMAYSIHFFSPFQRKGFKKKVVRKFSDYLFYQIGTTFAIQPTGKFAIGANFGYLFGFSKNNYKHGIAVQLGILTKILKERLNIGITFRPPTRLWKLKDDIKENTPFILNIGLGIMITRSIILSMDLDYQGWRFIKYHYKGKTIRPITIKDQWFKTINPHFGFYFHGGNTGINVRVGINTYPYWTSQGCDTQVNLTLGLGGKVRVGSRRDRNIFIEGAISDGILFHLISDQIYPIETLQLSIEYLF